jgi:monoamine oxidase
MLTMDRRSLLALATAVLLERFAGRAPAAETVDAETVKKSKVIVIGAGLAGLAAARTLQAQGQDVLVLEAQQRLGGRLWTSMKWPDAPLDLGASWIHGVTGNPLTELANEARAIRLETSYDRSVIYDSSGEELTEERETRLEGIRSRFHKALRFSQNADDDVSIRELVTRLTNQWDADEATTHLLNFIVSSEIEQEYAGSAKRVSTHWYDSTKAFGGEDVLFEQGFQVIVDLLSDDLTIQTGQVVKRIVWSDDSVRVVTNRGEFTSDKVLVTLPLGVLKAGSVEFVPALPNSTTEAISRLEMGVLNKCYLRFADVFWPDDVDWLEYIPRSHGEWTEWVSFARVADKPILLGFNAGDYGRRIEAWSDQEIVASAMQTLRRIFGAGIPNPVDFQITRWASDPFACGSYSFNAVGSHPKDRRRLAKPIQNKLFFAGEATEADYFGTAHGAYLSGIRAAAEILL